jgi:hypothetical protein
MRAFDVSLNGKKLCRAGIGDDGVLTTVLSWVTSKGAGDLFLEVGGLVSPVEEHISWVNQKLLDVGDTIQVTVVEAESVDEPTNKPRPSEAELLKARKRYVRKMAKQFGWKIQTGNLTPKT